MSRSRAKQRRAQRRRGRAEAQYQAGMRAGPKMPGTQHHYLAVDATNSLIDRSPNRARVGVILGAVIVVAALVRVVLGLLGG